MNKPKVGLLPMYIELYDRSVSFMRPRIEAFYKKIADELEYRGLKVFRSPVCRIRNEFEDTVGKFENQGADVIITLHLAYSPSLESAEVLLATKLPLILLDVTETYDMSPQQLPEEILYNHGIHGVQDLCNLLARNERIFHITAGHWKESDVLDRACSIAKAAKAVFALRNARVGIVGKPFEGMGDFAVAEEELENSIGIKTIHFDVKKGKELLNSITENELAYEMQSDREQFKNNRFSDEVFRRVTAAGLLLRKWIEKENLIAFTVNFMSVDTKLGLPAMPFLEASKAMARGIGYAGEGDMLTAALSGSLASIYPEVTFTEMFCPDWKNNCVLLSHMGEINISLVADAPILMEKDFPFTDVGNTIAPCGCLKPGKVVMADLAPGPGGRYTLIVISGEMLEVKGKDEMNESIRGWFKPSGRLTDFLEEYSMNGGTHHLVLVYDGKVYEINALGKMMGWNVVNII